MWGRIRHLLWFKKYGVDTIFIQKTSKGIILLNFRCSNNSCSLQISDHLYICTEFHEITLNGVRVIE